MRMSRFLRSGAKPLAPLPVCILFLSSCMSDGLDVAAGLDRATPPREATFRCDEGERLHVARLGSAVQVTDAEGDTIVLPPSPPGQDTRYGMDGYALVVEGEDALWMKAGATPRDCTGRNADPSID